MGEERRAKPARFPDIGHRAARFALDGAARVAHHVSVISIDILSHAELLDLASRAAAIREQAGVTERVRRAMEVLQAQIADRLEQPEIAPSAAAVMQRTAEQARELRAWRTWAKIQAVSVGHSCAGAADDAALRHLLTQAG